MAPSLEIRVLGELEIIRDGKTVPLPASKKTRALLGYLLVAAGRPQPRDRLCELLWDGPDDPRAALRWSLTKLRPLVDDREVIRLTADREHVAFEARGAAVDRVLVQEVERDAGAIANAPLDALRRAAALHRGELLEGLDLPECYRYHEWCTAEREAARRARGGVLASLVERLAGEPEEGLRYARALVAIDPLSEAAHIVVMQQLAKLGRLREAVKQYERCRAILEAQLGRRPSKELESARSAIGLVASVSVVPVERPFVRPIARGPLVGRSSERATIAEALADARAGVSRRVLLFSGEPGIGKTRLLGEVADQTLALGGTALFGRAFEAEMVRPYGAWIDVLRSAPPGAIDAALRPDLAQLLPELGATRHEMDRTRLFDAVARLLRELAGAALLTVALDDVQWFDDASAALLNYLSQKLVGSHIVFACAARPAELDANPRAEAIFRALLRETRLVRIDVAPLDRQETQELVRSVESGVDATHVFIDGGGNPLFSLELARALAHGEDATAAPTLDGLIAERLSRLDEHASDLLPWAAALGRAFSIETLGTLTSLPACDLMSAIEDLERHGVLRVASSAVGSVGYDFAHDLVRRNAYRAMSEPRRRWVHLCIARALHGSNDPDGALAGDIAHHAALGGDNELAARSYLAAGERALRLFAHADANRLAGSGLQHLERLPGESQVRLRLALLSVQVHSNQWLRRAHELESELSKAAVAAQQRGMHAEAARAYYLMSFVHHARGDFVNTRARTLEAVQAGRGADAETRHLQVANTGRCLALIERELAQAERLLREAQGIDPTTPRASMELAFGLGLIEAFKGRDDEAVVLLERAAALAEVEADPWSRCQALIRIVKLDLERRRPRDARARCEALAPLVAKLSGGSEGAFVEALDALAGLALGDDGAFPQVERAVDELRTIDSKAHVAYVLNTVAEYDVRAGRPESARRRIHEAVQAAETVGQKTELAVGRATLALIGLDREEPGDALALLDAYGPDLSTRLALSARARAAVTNVARRLSGEPEKPHAIAKRRVRKKAR